MEAGLQLVSMDGRPKLVNLEKNYWIILNYLSYNSDEDLR
jgi:hypothetical protein